MHDPQAEEDARLAKESEQILVENFTGFSDLKEFVYARIKPEQRAFLRERKYAFFAAATAFDPIRGTGNNYCYAVVGVTRPQPDDRNPRLPAARDYGFTKYQTKGELSPDQLSSCRVSALSTAIESFATTTLKGVLGEADRVEETGNRAPQPPAPTSINIFSQVGAHPDLDEVAQEVPDSFRRAFDQRKLSWVMLASHTTFDGNLVCFSTVGVAVTPPDGRNPRYPAERMLTIKEVDLANTAGGAADRCETDVLAVGVRSALEEPWDETGLLKKLEMTREPGVALAKGVHHH